MFRKMLHIDIWYDTESGLISLDYRLFNDMTYNDLSKLLTKTIVEKSRQSKQLENQSKMLMDIRDLVDKN